MEPNDKECREIVVVSCIVAFFGYGFLIFLAAINETIRAMLIGTAIGLVTLALYVWHRIKKIAKDEK